jgi:fusaric acid resistance family protein
VWATIVPVALRALLASRYAALRSSLLRVLQASVAASLAWWLARLIPHHPRPFFAPVAALIAMGAAPGTRGRQALDLIVGVVLGIAVAAAIATSAGTGTWQIGVAAGLAMLAGMLVSERPVVVIQAGASAVLLIALHQAGAAPGRLIDALIGGGVAIVIAQMLFPIDPLRIVADAAEERAEQLAAALRMLAASLTAGDAVAARRALSRIEAADGSRLADALEIGRGVARRAPRRRWERRGIEAYGELARELDSSEVNARALASGALRALRDGRGAPPDMAAAAAALAEALAGGEVEAETARARQAARRALAETPALGVSVFVHAAEALADHAERAGLAAEEARARSRRGRLAALRR